MTTNPRFPRNSNQRQQAPDPMHKIVPTRLFVDAAVFFGLTFSLNMF